MPIKKKNKEQDELNELKNKIRFQKYIHSQI